VKGAKIQVIHTLERQSRRRTITKRTERGCNRADGVAETWGRWGKGQRRKSKDVP